MSVEWNASYSVKVKELDDQHYQLFTQTHTLEEDQLYVEALKSMHDL